MCPGILTELPCIDGARKTALIDRELHRLNIDIAALQETRLPSTGSVKEKNYTFFWQGLAATDRRLHGVGFAVRSSLLSSIDKPSQGTERMLSLRLHASTGHVNIISAYAPTLSASVESNDAFYDQLEAKIKSIPTSEELFILGDFNARVGTDNTSWPRCIGQFGIGKLNRNGQRLLEFCSYHDLCVTNTFFSTKMCQRTSWRHPRSHHWHQLDLVITRRSHLNQVLITRSYHSADCDTDHSLVASKVRLLPKRLHNSKPKMRPRINTARMAIPSLREKFNAAIDEKMQDCPEQDINVKWDFLRDAMYQTSFEVFGKKTRSNEDWFEFSIAKLEPVIKAKRDAMLRHKNQPCDETKSALRTASNSFQRLSRKCANDYWLNLCSGIQKAADIAKTHAMYEGIKKAVGPTIIKSAPLKSATGKTITDHDQQMERWAEHFQELYSRESHVTDTAINGTAILPQMTQLDEPPTLEDLIKAIDSLSCNKAPGTDGIPPEVLKISKKSLLAQELLSLLQLCWEKGVVPQDMRDAKVVTLYKNKGDRGDCNNHRGISLLSILGKAFARVALDRLHVLSERVYPESQCGFISARSTIDVVFSLRQGKKNIQRAESTLISCIYQPHQSL